MLMMVQAGCWLLWSTPTLSTLCSSSQSNGRSNVVIIVLVQDMVGNTLREELPLQRKNKIRFIGLMFSWFIVFGTTKINLSHINLYNNTVLCLIISKFFRIRKSGGNWCGFQRHSIQDLQPIALRAQRHLLICTSAQNSCGTWRVLGICWFFNLHINLNNGFLFLISAFLINFTNLENYLPSLWVVTGIALHLIPTCFTSHLTLLLCTDGAKLSVFIFQFIFANKNIISDCVYFC